MPQTMLALAALAALAACNGPAPQPRGPSVTCRPGDMHASSDACLRERRTSPQGGITISGTARIGVVVAE